MINPYGFNPFPVDNSKITMTLDELLKTKTGRVIGNMEITYDFLIWNFDCEWYYNSVDQQDFQRKVIDHFRFRQIGFETPGRFLFEFQKKFKEIMPYYKKMYQSVELMDAIDDPLENYSMIEESTTTGNSSSETTGTDNQTLTNDVRLNKHLATPQGRVQNLTDGYMSYADKTESTSDTTTGRSDSTTTGEAETTTTLTRRGNIGVTTYAEMLEGYRKTFLNIDMMICDELEDCFLQVL